MARFDKGVAYYTRATTEVFFPENDICCKWCPLLGCEMALNRKYCKRTGELLLSPDYQIGQDCPLIFDKNESEDETWNPLSEE